MKSKKHKRIIKDFAKQKSNHLEKLASKMLKDDEMNSQLKSKIINLDFLKLF